MQGAASRSQEGAIQARPEQRSPARRAVIWGGLALMLVGFGFLSYVAWELFGTNYISKQTHERIVRELEEEWSVIEGTTITDPEPGDALALIRIPAFGEDYVVPVVEGVGDDELASGFGHFPDTALAGQVGNYALAAHRITNGEPLRGMPDLRPGDEVIVETRDAVYRYELDTNPNDLVVGFEDAWVVDPLPRHPDGGVQPAQRQGQRLITLTTCAELFHTDHRMIAFGHLVDTQRK